MADPVVTGVRNINTSYAVDRYTAGIVQGCRGGWPVLAGIVRFAVTRDRGNDAVRRYFADSIVAGVRNVNICCVVNRHTGRKIEGRCDGWPVIARVVRSAIAGNQVDDTRR